MHDREKLMAEVKAQKKELATRYSKEESARFDTILVANEEQKTEIEYLREQVAKASITTADKLESYDVFMPRKMVLELSKEIETLNWKKNLPGLVYTVDGKFVQKVKAGVPE